MLPKLFLKWLYTLLRPTLLRRLLSSSLGTSLGSIVAGIGKSKLLRSYIERLLNYMRQKLTEAWKARVRAMSEKVGGDGCSSSPNLFYKPCCDAHDVAYRTGLDVDSKPVTRAKADKDFLRCMRKAGKTPILGRTILPVVYYLAVRMFGRKQWKGK